MAVNCHLSFVWLLLAPCCLCLVTGFVLGPSPPSGLSTRLDHAAGRLSNLAALELLQANLELKAVEVTAATPATGGEGEGDVMCCSIRSGGRGNTLKFHRRGRGRRCRCSVTTAVSCSAVDPPRQVEEVVQEPGIELALREPAVREFEAWTASAGFRGNSAILSHADFEGLRGVMTKAAMEPWQPMATVPSSLFLQEDLLCPGLPLQMAPPAPLSAAAWRRCPWWVRLGVRLLLEKSVGEESRLKEYVRLLPSPGEMGSPMNWSVEQLDRLHYPRLLSQVKLQRRLFKGFRMFLLADAKRGESGRAPGEGAGTSSLTDALGDAASFNWALECVLSRAFQLPPDDASALIFEKGDDIPVKAPELTPPSPEATRMALLPLIDSMNHYSRVPTHMYWEADGALSLSVGSSFDPGDHAFLSYGPVSNDDLLQYYGFVERDNPSDAYVLEDLAKWLREDALLGAELSRRLVACSGAREVWRYLRRGVFLRDAVHPTTMQALRIVSCEAQGHPDGGNAGGDSELRWDGSEADLERFGTPVSLASELSTLEVLLRYCAREADAWGEAGVAAALAEDPKTPGLDGDLDGLGLDVDRRLMLSVFRQEKISLLRGILSRLTHMRKVSAMLQRPIKMPVKTPPPAVLGPVGVV